jgi:hypothetical protein
MLTLRGGLCSLPFLGGIRVTHLLSFLYCVCGFFCLRPMSCVRNVASFSRLSVRFSLNLAHVLSSPKETNCYKERRNISLCLYPIQ